LDDEQTTRAYGPLAAVWRLVIQMTVGTLLFAAIAGLALLLSYLARVIGVPSELVLVTKFLEVAMLAMDFLLFAVFLARAFVAAWKAFREAAWRQS
jgi:hypothetical protein